MKMANMKSKLRKFICWRIVFSLLLLGTTIYGVIYLKNLSVKPTDIIFFAVMGLIATFIFLFREETANDK